MNDIQVLDLIEKLAASLDELGRVGVEGQVDLGGVGCGAHCVWLLVRVIWIYIEV